MKKKGFMLAMSAAMVLSMMMTGCGTADTSAGAAPSYMLNTLNMIERNAE